MKTVLWGDNEEAFLDRATRFLFRYFQHTVMDAVKDPSLVIQSAVNNKYDVIITDFNYENMLTGLDVIRRIRYEDPMIPVYLCTNRIAGEKIRVRFNLIQPLQKQSLEAGATGFFSKFDLMDDPEKVAFILRKYLE